MEEAASSNNQICAARWGRAVMLRIAKQQLLLADCKVEAIRVDEEG